MVWPILNHKQGADPSPQKRIIQMTRCQIAAALSIALSLVLLLGCGAPPRLVHFQLPDVGHPAVRVLLSFSEREYTIEGSGRFVTRGTTSTGGQVTYYCSRPVHLVYAHSRWTLSEKNQTILETDLLQVSIHSKNRKDDLSINGKPYPGSLLFYPPQGEGDSPRVINRVDVDDYLLGVLPPELGKRTPQEFEAVKAQAVAARTYALSHLGQYTDTEYDLRADVFDQIYIGLQEPYPWVKKAIAQTAGEILRHEGNLIEAYYHSTCGGHTDDITAVWGKDPLAYLVTTEDDTFCHWSKYYAWTEMWDGSTLKRNLAAYLKSDPEAPFDDFERITSIRTEGRTAGGRVQRLVVITDRGSWEIATDQARRALGHPSTGGPILQSARFALYPEYDQEGNLIRMTAVGGGYGHGVGMCQCGMIGRARAGHGYRRILTHYYPGVTIEKTY